MMHRADVVSLVFGLLFVAGAGLWAVVEWDVISASSLAYVVPIGLVAVGLAGMATALTRQRAEAISATDDWDGS